MIERKCAWCRGPIPDDARVDSITCSKRCRQARSRFALSVGGAPHTSPIEPRRFAYADPPYPGMSKRYYGDHPDYAGEVDHAELIRRLSTYDGWALSTAAASLQFVLALCPPGARVAAWHRGERPNLNPDSLLNAWEPVIYFGARPVVPSSSDVSRGDRETGRFSGNGVWHDVPRVTRRASTSDMSRLQPRRIETSRPDPATRRVDSLVLGVTPRTTDPSRVVGAKPAGFARWMFDLLGLRPEDSFDDLFAGSGAIARAWDIYVERARA